MHRLLTLLLCFTIMTLGSCESGGTDDTAATGAQTTVVPSDDPTTTIPTVESTTTALTVESTTTIPYGEVIVHRPGAEPASLWPGRIVEDTAPLGFVLVAEANEPQAPRPWDPLGMYRFESVVLTSERGSCDVVESRAQLIEVADAQPGEPASVEMLWLGWQGTDPDQYEIQAALEHPFVEGFHLHAACYTVETDTFAVALVDADLQPTVAWEIDRCFTEFLPVDESTVQCEADLAD